jgi:lysophospholipase L1-like esterase
MLNKIYRKYKIKKVPMTGHEYYMESLWKFFAVRTKTLQKHSNQLVFLGDSLTNGLCVESLFNGLNLGISGESINRAKSKVSALSNLENKRIFLAYGINDIPGETNTIFANYVELINNLPQSTVIYISSILPIEEDIAAKYWPDPKKNWQIQEVNQLMKNYAQATTRVHFLDTAKHMYDSNGQLQKNLHKGDGIHLSIEGSLRWAKTIEEELSAIAPDIDEKQPTRLV